MNAVGALGMIGPDAREAVPLLLKKLQDKDSFFFAGGECHCNFKDDRRWIG